jgi:hypothetical protein
MLTDAPESERRMASDAVEHGPDRMDKLGIAGPDR